MSETKKIRTRQGQREKVCNTSNDVITDENFTDSSVQIYHKKEDIGNEEKAECYLKSTLKSSFTAIIDEYNPRVTEWKRLEKGRWVEKPKTNRIYKLPLSGIWITGESARKLVCSKNRIFLVKKPAIKMMIGSSFGQSNIHDFVTDVHKIVELDGVGKHSSYNCVVQVKTTDMVPYTHIRFYENINLKCFRRITRKILKMNKYKELVDIVNDIDYNNMRQDPRDKLLFLDTKINDILRDTEDVDLTEIKVEINNCIRDLFNFILYRDDNLGGKFLIDKEDEEEVEQEEEEQEEKEQEEEEQEEKEQEEEEQEEKEQEEEDDENYVHHYPEEDEEQEQIRRQAQLDVEAIDDDIRYLRQQRNALEEEDENYVHHYPEEDEEQEQIRRQAQLDVEAIDDDIRYLRQQRNANNSWDYNQLATQPRLNIFENANRQDDIVENDIEIEEDETDRHPQDEDYEYWRNDDQ